MKATLKAFAKINLRLKVINSVNLNNQVFHNLEMINRRIGLYDKITLECANIDSIEYIYNKNIKPISINEEDDSIFKAYKDFKKRFSISDHYLIKIYRNIPIGSGLGAIPSCIAEIFKFLNKRYLLKLTTDELIKIGMDYGKDIPYMYFNGMCVVRGLGEKIQPLTDNIKDNIIVIYPNISISTKDIFNNTNIINKEKDIYSFNYDLIFNDLEQVTSRLHPEMINVKTFLSSLEIKKIVMSGSGSSYILLVDKKNTKKVINKIKKLTNYFIYLERI